MRNENSGKLDQLDCRIILEVQNDPRSSYRDIASKLGVSESAVRRRLNALLESGVISVSAVPDPHKMGYQLVAYIGLHVNPSNIDVVARRLVDLPHLHYISRCSGTYDFMVWGYFTSTTQLADFVSNHIGQIPGVVKAETIVQLRVLKASFSIEREEMSETGVMKQEPGAIKAKDRRRERSGRRHGPAVERVTRRRGRRAVGRVAESMAASEVAAAKPYRPRLRRAMQEAMGKEAAASRQTTGPKPYKPRMRRPRNQVAADTEPVSKTQTQEPKVISKAAASAGRPTAKRRGRRTSGSGQPETQAKPYWPRARRAMQESAGGVGASSQQAAGPKPYRPRMRRLKQEQELAASASSSESK